MLLYQEYLNELLNWNEGHMRFKLVCEDTKYINIHPVKQGKVKKLVDEILELDKAHCISKIILFGSSIKFSCSSSSDIDLLVLGTFEYFNIPIHTSKYGEVDLLTYNEKEFMELLPTTKLFQKILREGVVLYE